MTNYDEFIGKNIKEVRTSKGLSQQALAEKCGFSNTVLSAYENSKKIPSLSTIATIARALDVNIERLYYGDDSIAFIKSAPDVGRKIVNSLYFLWEYEVVMCIEKPFGSFSESTKDKNGFWLVVSKYPQAVSRLMKSLNEYKMNKETYPDPEGYLEMILSSVATEINKSIYDLEQQKVRLLSTTNPSGGRHK